jgi:hypothetical protein
MNKAMVQDLLDNFVMKNETNFDRVSDENPILYNAVIDALDFLSVRFGTGVHIPKIEKEEPKIEKEEPNIEKEKVSLNVGDYFINDFDPPIVFKIIDFMDSGIGFVEAEKGDNSFRFGTGVGEAVSNFESGKWVKVEPKSIDEEIKEGDILQDSADDQTNFKVLLIGNDLIDLEKLWNGETYSTKLKIIKDRVKKGSLIKITEAEFLLILQQQTKELKEAIEGLETAFDYLEDDEKTQLEELRQKLSQLQQKKS